jgi:hypothetical protein
VGQTTFTVIVSRDRMEFCVRIVLPDGEHKHINHFASKQDAQRWIRNESQTWLQLRFGNAPAQGDEEDERANVSGRLTRVNFSQLDDEVLLVA